MPAIIAHRGLGGVGRENTVEAVASAVALGVDGVEIDVHRTADGVLVVHHDADVAGLVIATATAAEVLAAGRRRGVALPTFAEVLDVVPEHVVLDVELKARGHERQVVEAAAAARPLSACVFTSFNPETVRALRGLDAGARIGLLVGQLRPDGTHLADLLTAIRQAEDAGADFLAPNRLLVPVLARATDPRSATGLWVWTVNGARVMRRLMADDRVAAIITDHPARALALRAAMAGAAPGPGTADDDEPPPDDLAEG